MRRHVLVWLAAAMLTAASCASADDEVVDGTSTTAATTATSSSTTTTSTTSTTTTTLPASTTTTTLSPFARPDWLGNRLLPVREDGHGEAQPTPPELLDRRLETLDLLPPPDGDEFAWTIEPVPPEVAARSSWSEDCPVVLEDLAYVTVSHYGFDGEYHTGEMVLNAEVAEDIVEVFRKLHEARFPIEQMRVIRADEIDAPPTGDSNITSSFECRPAVGSDGGWSWHASGLAVDINPFHNPYLKDDLVLPELAMAYTDRERVLPGMVMPGDVVVEAFTAIGWHWGGDWTTLKDWMHFSRDGG